MRRDGAVSLTTALRYPLEWRLSRRLRQIALRHKLRKLLAQMRYALLVNGLHLRQCSVGIIKLLRRNKGRRVVVGV